MKRKSVWGILALTVTMLVVSACGGARSQPPAATTSGGSGGGSGQTFTMKVANDTAKDVQEEVTFKYAELVTELSKGRIKATGHSGASLGTNAESAKGLQSGSVEAMVSPSGFVTQFMPEFGVLDLPFALPAGIEEMTKAVKGKAGQLLRQKAEEKGFHVVGLFGIGPQNFYTNFPVTKAEDLKGKKFRVIPAPERTGAFKSWGALAVGMQFGEVYTSLQQGTIQGLELPPDFGLKSKMYEVAPYYTLSGHSSLIELVVVSKKWYDSLPKDLQAVVDQAGIEVEKFGVKQFIEMQQKSLEDFRKLPKVTVAPLAEAERQKLREMALNGVWKDIEKDPVKGPIVQMLLEDIKATTK